MTEKGEWNKNLRPISFALKALVAWSEPDVLSYFSVENTGQSLEFAPVRSFPQLYFVNRVLGSRDIEVVNIDYPHNC